ncbi:putative nuclease HARBI1 [Xenia sp. Carnegie-2017]|uniref:putative nuclease HARBI1 n=1 Tax=Xenia sp. Carnegie-2017 TaxID=2897299 RepID=UPI001F033C7D|nr:putative nuclease HARBI1 [Xenia sp. Carnegie-2017]
MAAENHKNITFQVIQCGILIALIIQCCGMAIAYRMMQQKRLRILDAYFQAKTKKLMRKRRHLMLRRLCRKPRSTWVVFGRTDQWWRNLISENALSISWKKNLRMSKENFYRLVAELDPVIGPKPNSPNYRLLSSSKKVAVTLYYLKDTGSLWMTANTFGIHQCTASKVIKEVCSAINKLLGPKYIFLPKNENEMRKKASEFELKFGMVQAFGLIDGTHIPIKCPPENSQDFFNYKQYFSLNVQAVCDSKGYFMDVECRWPGSVHDAKVFANSSVCKRLNRRQLPISYLTLLPGHDPVPNYLIGDPAYPLTQFCLKEYQTCTDNAQIIFNSMLRSARNQIECAFGRLKARWGFLNRKVDIKFDLVPTVIYSCFVLHNFCEQNGDFLLNEKEIYLQVIQHVQDEDTTPNVPDQIYSCNNLDGETVHSLLTDYITHNLPYNYY